MVGHIPPAFCMGTIHVGKVVLESAQLDQAEQNQEERKNGNFNNGDPEHVAEDLHVEEHEDADYDDQSVNDHGNDAEDSDRLSVVLHHPPVSFEDAKGVEPRVVSLVALESAE